MSGLDAHPRFIGAPSIPGPKAWIGAQLQLAPGESMIMESSTCWNMRAES
jgi:hypothetical protein